ncbi:unnamed protein product [Lactuca saligna]|uniref:Heat shock protein 70 n=1 Tax=Lactuca saligna TaxID=75948 RepID=A0AA35YD90_LACSI|nr:unnamed protein product [Lactuca saligna]
MSYFDDSQRQATKDAGYVAGLNVLQIINEPTSAAIAYGFDMSTNITRGTNVLIFDLGGGTFDVSIVTIDVNGTFRVNAVAGDTNLGGQDFDNVMVEHFVKQFNEKHSTYMSGNVKALSRLKMVDSCLCDPGFNKTDIDEVVLVGGSTRIPKVQQLLKDFFDGKELSKKINPDEAVAYGATVLAAKLSGESSPQVSNFELNDIVPLSLGVALYDTSLSVIVKKNAKKPLTRQANYTTTEDNQSAILFNVYQGQRTRAIDNNWLGEFTVAVPVAPKGTSQVKVVFDIDDDGILNCSGEEVTTGLTKKVRIDHDKQRLSKADIKKMVQDAQRYKIVDEEFTEKNSARSDLEDYIYKLKNKIKSIRSKIRSEDIEKMENAIEDVRRQILHGMKLAEVKEYTTKSDLLANICVPILARYP